jgi:hypothetical protein
MDTRTGRLFSEAESLAAIAMGAKLEHVSDVEQRVLSLLAQEDRVAALGIIRGMPDPTALAAILENVPEGRRMEALVLLRAIGIDRLRNMSKKEAAEIDAAMRGLRLGRAQRAQADAVSAPVADKHRLARVAGESDEDHRAIRNAQKRARRTRGSK